MKETKFRRLRRDELEEVRDQFIKFLGVNGIDADSWQNMKVDEPQKADRLILQFSQIVFEGVIKRIEYLVQKRPRDLRTYRLHADKIEMRGILLEGETSLDLSNTEVTPQDMLITLRADGAKVKLFSGERAYNPSIGREQDIFLLMEAGALIDDGELFGILTSL
jgi:cag pathogenicity island protein 24